MVEPIEPIDGVVEPIEGAIEPIEEPRFACYLLCAAGGAHARRYVGMTVDLARRLRQHNGDLVGGARRTRAGRPWTHAATLTGFDTLREALRAEWRLKRLGRGRRGPEGLLAGLRDEVAGNPGGRWTRASADAYGGRRLELRCSAAAERKTPGLREAAASVGWGFDTF